MFEFGGSELWGVSEERTAGGLMGEGSGGGGEGLEVTS